MPLPFVSRSDYNTLAAQLDRANDRVEDYKRTCETRDEIIAGLKAQVAEERAEKRDLLARFTQLRVMGAVDVTPHDPPSPVAPADDLEDLIVQVCGADQRKAAMMMRQLAADREDERPEDEIRDEILNGRRVSAEEGLPA